MTTNSSLPAIILSVYKKYERYAAWCQMLGIVPAELEQWQKENARISENKYSGETQPTRLEPLAFGWS
jgi:hypothetical protein